ncbi:MAG: tRNA threonylcarbamoyladenosine dehydratase [Spirochaetaceae bacterium]|jgi:tRNA A37 threonylcarbamoyladenosine dehydratase|nr:tRNA threonylcarbamoyladenosine dehydratase [Spirochaetaceae bacterium]
MNPKFQRLALLAGPETVDALSHTKVIVFGLGGVGSWCAEALIRSGIGHLKIVDSDTVCVTNINRQIQATPETIGQFKAEVLKKRLKEIAPEAEIAGYNTVFSRETAGGFGLEEADYVIDAIDSLTHKLDLIEYACARGKRLFSSMGMAQKLDPTRLKTGDIWETEGCPLARLVRSGLRKRGLALHFTAVYSPERLPLSEAESVCGSGKCLCPARPDASAEWCSSKKVINGSAVTVTAAAGMILAGLVIQDVYGHG